MTGSLEKELWDGEAQMATGGSPRSRQSVRRSQCWEQRGSEMRTAPGRRVSLVGVGTQAGLGTHDVTPEISTIQLPKKKKSSKQNKNKKKPHQKRK